MVTKLFMIYDSKAEVYLKPFDFRTIGEAIRWFLDVGKQDAPWGKHPADYTLFEVGTFDCESGMIEMHDAKINLGTALENNKEGAVNGAA